MESKAVRVIGVGGTLYNPGLGSRCPTRVSLLSWRTTTFPDRRRLDSVLGSSYHYNSFLPPPFIRTDKGWVRF